MESRPGHRATRSFHAIRTSVAVLPMAPFSPGRSELEYSCRTRLSRGNLRSILPGKGSGFESQEPTSPKVSCIGQIKLKHRLAKECNQEKCGQENSSKENKNKMAKLKKFIFGGHNGNTNNKNRIAETEGEEEKKCTKALVSHPSLGQIKRFTSGSYDAKFGDMFVQKDAEPLSLEALPPKGGRNEEDPCIWKRRSVAAPKELEVCRIP